MLHSGAQPSPPTHPPPCARQVIECEIAPQVASRGVGVAPYKGRHAQSSGGEAVQDIYRQAAAGAQAAAPGPSGASSRPSSGGRGAAGQARRGVALAGAAAGPAACHLPLSPADLLPLLSRSPATPSPTPHPSTHPPRSHRHHRPHTRRARARGARDCAAAQGQGHAGGSSDAWPPQQAQGRQLALHVRPAQAPCACPP